MSRDLLSFRIPDLSAFARSLAREIAQRSADKPEPPGHVETLNLLARALGHRNVQALRASLRDVPLRAADREEEAPLPLSDNARKALGQFDRQGRLMRWPHKLTVQRMAMWVLWTRFEAKRSYTEREVNAILKDANGFSDHVTLRRELVDHRLLARKSDCSEYWKLPARPDAETQALLTAWRARVRGEGDAPRVHRPAPAPAQANPARRLRPIPASVAATTNAPP